MEGEAAKNEEQQDRSRGGWLAAKVLGVAAEVTAKGALKAPVEGTSNLEEIDLNRPVMFVGTHLTDVDIQIAVDRLYTLKGYEMVVANQTTQHKPKDFASKAISLVLDVMGRDRFYPLGWEWGREGKAQTVFKLDDYKKLKEQVFGRKRVLVVAGHNPTLDGKLAKNPGLAAAMVTQVAEGVQIVPVAVVLAGKAPDAYDLAGSIKRRGSQNPRMVIGKVFSVDKKISDEELGELERGFEGELKRKLVGVLRETGGEIMRRLAELLPAEKRGVWGNQGKN
jgi:hypothetical protein